MNTHYKIEGKALQLANAFGFLFPGEVFLIQAITQTLKDNGVVVCLGTGAGTFTLAVAEINPKLEIYSIDISEGGPEGGLLNERNAFDNAGIKPYPIQILGDTNKVCNRWTKISKGKKIDLLLIDADHSTKSLIGDIEGWLPYINNKGFVLFHDYESKFWAGVKSVIDERINAPTWRKVLLVDTLIAFQRAK